MAKRILDRLKWHPGKSLKGVNITYIHRGALDDCMTVSAEDVIELEKSFFVVERGSKKVKIPYHRIQEIRRGEEVLWRKG